MKNVCKKGKMSPPEYMPSDTLTQQGEERGRTDF